MIQRTTKLRLRRIFRRRKRQVEGMGTVADAQLDKHFFRRLARLIPIRRFFIGWVAFIILVVIAVAMQFGALLNHYRKIQPVPGGTYTEGIIGTYTNVNPIYATGAVDSSVSRLLFGSLLKYDENSKLVPDLAESYTVDTTETVYTVTLKPDLVWHDGISLTSRDVVFTYKTIQNPDARSYLFSSWKGVSVEAPDDRTVVFKLASTLSAFPHALTNGIIPEHSLGQIPADQLRSNDFNTAKPVGAGPFQFERLEVDSGEAGAREERVAMAPFNEYHAGMPLMSRFVIRTFKEQKSLEESYQNKEISAMVGLSTAPDILASDSSTKEYGVPLTGETMIFFKTSSGVLSEAAVRRALALATDKFALFSQIPYPLVNVDSPFLRSHVGYDKTHAQVVSNMAAANAMLDGAGWVRNPQTGIRSKADAPLSFRLFAESTSEYATVTQLLQKQWREAGVDLQVMLQPEQDLQTTASTHNYEALLYSISIGPDPDVYAYWHSSQADPRSSARLNFSEYNSRVADTALEAGRSRSDPTIRAVKYKPFLEVWKNDAPAIALYQPRFLYIVRQPLYGFEMNSGVVAVDRYAHVEKWMIREAKK